MNLNKKYIIILLVFASQILCAQKPVTFKFSPSQREVKIFIDNKYFSSFLFSDTLEKPILFPLLTSNGIKVTRGFPISPEKGEQVDHPHHTGLWLNYESVNGIDFWNNSYAIANEKKSKYGWIRNVKVTSLKDGGNEGALSYTANWEKQDKSVLLKEETTFKFRGDKNARYIERQTKLTAQKDTVHFNDVKDGLLGLRVAKELEGPSDKPKEFIDVHGKVTSVNASPVGTGHYITSKGKKGKDAWGTQADWCLLKGIKNNEVVSIAIVDHPFNPGYPTYWHAREYGLFAANPLGRNVFSQGNETLNLTLAPGTFTTLKYLIIIQSGKELKEEDINKLMINFQKNK